MENIEQILQKLVAVNLPPLESDKVQHLIKHAFEAGKAEQADPLAGYSNLTSAIIAGEPIDYERLDGLKVRCVNPDIGTNRGMLKRITSGKAEFCGSWWNASMDDAYIRALIHGWAGEDGWTLWLEGDIPLVRKTADQLEVGTYFLGNCKLVAEGFMYVGRDEESIEKAIRFVPSMTISQFGAEDWEVIEEHGTFQKPEEDK